MFDVALAEKYGPIESIILSHLCFWIEKNQHNQKNFHDGRYWVYNSAAAFEKIFPYLNKDQIRRVLDKLDKKGALYIDNFNKIGYDRTLWYSVSDEVMDIYTAGKGNNRETPSAQMGNIAQTGKWGKNDGKIEDLTEIDPSEPDPPENVCPNGQLHFANSLDAFAQTGNIVQPGKWGENEEKPPENACPNGQMHFAESPDRFGKNATSIPQIRQIDSAESPDRFDENATPIPDINIYKPSAKPSADGEAAEKNYNRESLIQLFFNIDRRFVFSENFYLTVQTIFGEHGLGEDYCQWLYRECLKMKPENIRGLYYTLFNKPEMIRLFLLRDTPHNDSGGINPTIRCLVCKTSFTNNLPECPSCKMRTENMRDNSAVERHKRYITLSDEQKNQYNDAVFNLFSRRKELSAAEIENELQKLDAHFGLASVVHEGSA